MIVITNFNLIFITGSGSKGWVCILTTDLTLFPPCKLTFQNLFLITNGIGMTLTGRYKTQEELTAEFLEYFGSLAHDVRG